LLCILQKTNGEVKLGFSGDLYPSVASKVMTTTGDIVRYDSERERYGIHAMARRTRDPVLYDFHQSR